MGDALSLLYSRIRHTVIRLYCDLTMLWSGCTVMGLQLWPDCTAICTVTCTMICILISLYSDYHRIGPRAIRLGSWAFGNLFANLFRMAHLSADGRLTALYSSACQGDASKFEAQTLKIKCSMYELYKLEAQMHMNFIQSIRLYTVPSYAIPVWIFRLYYYEYGGASWMHPLLNKKPDKNMLSILQFVTQICKDLNLCLL